MSADGELTDKQRAWLEEYLVCFDATAAARKAGYSDPVQSGWENKTRQDIRDLIKARLAEKAMEADEVLARLADQARGTMGDFLTIGPKGGAKVDLPKAFKSGKLHLLHRYSKGKGGIVSFELYDAQAALVHIGKNLGLFTDRVEHSGAIKIERTLDLSKLSDEELDRLEELHRKATPVEPTADQD